ncbi:MAG: hypothetical protein E7294_07300 [Lachnospiraceae bacterium]|jgi:hypothetical protein|nr:hypothetical protein [Lachnospiraceae bacterium]
MIELFEQDIKTKDRQSSKGNQLKWKKAQIWYKADYTGYEGLSEYLISHLLLHSSLEPEEFVCYDLEQIHYKSNIYNGAKCLDFLTDRQELITLERLYQNMTGKSLTKEIRHIPEGEERFQFLVRETEKYIGLTDFARYLNKLFTIDAFFLNEDRHMHNIAVLMDPDGTFEYCPVFDNGAALLSDTTMDYPLKGNMYSLLADVSAKTISRSFDEQLDLSENYCGTHMTFSFTKKDVEELLEDVKIYPDEIKNRVRDLVFYQMRKYQYLF